MFDLAWFDDLDQKPDDPGEFDPDLVAPKWGQFWEKPIAVWPFWDFGSGSPIEIISKQLTLIQGTEGAFSWESRQTGSAIFFSDTGTGGNDSKTIRFTPNYNFTAAGPFSVILAFSRDPSTPDGSDFLCGTGLGDGWYIRWSSASGDLLYKIDDGANDAFSAGNATGLDDGKLHIAVLVCGEGRLKAYMDGVLEIDLDATGVGNLANEIVVGGIRDSGEYQEGPGSNIHYLAVIEGIVTQNTARRITRDFFGFLRMRDEIPVVGLSVLFTSANLALHHSGASDIGGAIGAALTNDQLNNIWDDVSSPDASAGDNEFRCTVVKNTHGSITVSGAKVVLATGPAESGWRIGLGAAGKNGTETEIADENTAPAGVTFGTGPLDLGDLGPGDHYPIWIERDVSAGAGAATPDAGVLHISGTDPN